MPHTPETYKKVLRPIFNGEKPVFATVLLAALVRQYGVECLNWDGVTFQMQVKDDLGVEMPRVVYDQVMALITAMTTDQFYHDSKVFDHIVSALNREGKLDDPDLPSVEEVAWAVMEVELNDPQPVFAKKDKTPFSRDVINYVRAVLDDEGVSVAPHVLSFAPTKRPSTGGIDDEELYTGVWGSKQREADEIDQYTDRQIGTLVTQLEQIGINIKTQAKEASYREVLKDAPYDEVDGYRIYHVSGADVRNDADVEFVGGNNSEHDPDELPPKSILLETLEDPQDETAILAHEIVEYFLIKRCDYTYETAHSWANDFEKRLRKGELFEPTWDWLKKQNPDAGSVDLPKKLWDSYRWQEKIAADWTSLLNRETHVKKHAPEFGSEEDYLAAAAAPMDPDAKPINQRCKVDPTGDVSCATAHFSPSTGIVRVTRDNDGKIVTVYKKRPRLLEAATA